MGFFLRKPRIIRVPRKPSVRIGPVRVRRGGGSVTAGPVGWSWRNRKQRRG
jgi:hypothetical protein